MVAEINTSSNWIETLLNRREIILGNGNQPPGASEVMDPGGGPETYPLLVQYNS